MKMTQKMSRQQKLHRTKLYENYSQELLNDMRKNISLHKRKRPGEKKIFLHMKV